MPPTWTRRCAPRKAFDHGPWPRMSPSERGRLLWKLSDLIEKHAEDFATLEALDNAKPLTVARIADDRLVALHIPGGLGSHEKIAHAGFHHI